MNTCLVCNGVPDLHECLSCGERDCPESEPLHYHHDGCPLCATKETCTNCGFVTHTASSAWECYKCGKKQLSTP